MGLWILEGLTIYRNKADIYNLNSQFISQSHVLFYFSHIVYLYDLNTGRADVHCVIDELVDIFHIKFHIEIDSVMIEILCWIIIL